MTSTRKAILAVAALLAVVCLTACGSPPMSGTTKCSDFLRSSQGNRDRVVLDLAKQYDRPNLTSPLGRPNAEYNCTEHPERTLADALGLTSSSTAPPAAAQPTPDSGETVTAEPPAQVVDAADWSADTKAFADDEGYKSRYHIEASLQSATSDTTSAPPGKTDWTPPLLALRVNITNLTPGGREAPVHVMTAAAYWTTTTDLCQLVVDESVADPPPLRVSSNRAFCPLASSYVGDEGTAPVPPEGSLDLESAPPINGGTRQIREADAAMLDALTAQPPDGWLVTGSGGPVVGYRLLENDEFHSNFSIVASKGLPKPCKDATC